MALLSIWTPGAPLNSPAAPRATARLSGDSVVLVVTDGRRAQEQRDVVSPGAALLLDGAVGLDEWLIRDHLSALAGRIDVQVFCRQRWLRAENRAGPRRPRLRALFAE